MAVAKAMEMKELLKDNRNRAKSPPQPKSREIMLDKKIERGTLAEVEKLQEHENDTYRSKHRIKSPTFRLNTTRSPRRELSAKITRNNFLENEVLYSPKSTTSLELQNLRQNIKESVENYRNQKIIRISRALDKKNISIMQASIQNEMEVKRVEMNFELNSLIKENTKDLPDSISAYISKTIENIKITSIYTKKTKINSSDVERTQEKSEVVDYKGNTENKIGDFLVKIKEQIGKKTETEMENMIKLTVKDCMNSAKFEIFYRVEKMIRNWSTEISPELKVLIPAEILNNNPSDLLQVFPNSIVSPKYKFTLPKYCVASTLQDFIKYGKNAKFTN